MPIKLIIGGEPHSGKSTFMSMLSDRLRSRGVGVELLDLDLASPTICYLYSGDERTRCKKIWNEALSAEARRKFQDAQGQVVLADSVGKITDVTRTITHPADASIIVSVNHGNIEKWQKFYYDMGKPIVSVVESGRNCASVYDTQSKRGKICDISREKYVRGELGFDPVVEQLADDIVEMFNIMPASNRGMYMSNPRKKVSKKQMNAVLKSIEKKRISSRAGRIRMVYDTEKFPQIKAEVSPEAWKRMVQGLKAEGEVKVRGGGKYHIKHDVTRINPQKFTSRSITITSDDTPEAEKLEDEVVDTVYSIVGEKGVAKTPKTVIQKGKRTFTLTYAPGLSKEMKADIVERLTHTVLKRSNPYDIVELTRKKMAVPGFTEWEGDVIRAVEDLLEVDTSDAQGIIEGQEMQHGGFLIAEYKKGTDPAGMAMKIDKMSRVKGRNPKKEGTNMYKYNPKKLKPGEKTMSQQLDRLVARFVQQWREGDMASAKHTRLLIEEIAGKDAMPFAPTSRELNCPRLFAKTISCSSQVLAKQGKTKIKPWAVCRSALRKTPCK